MKKFAFILIAILSGMSAYAEDQVKWISKVHDFGAFDEDTKSKTAYFKFVNTTDEPVSIVSATATCGCTVPKYADEPIAPGDTAVIEVSYDPSGRPGRFEKQVYVRTSDSYDRTKLIIKGTVIGNAETIKGRYPVSMGQLKLRNGVVMMGNAVAGHDKMSYIDGYNASKDSIQPLVVKAPSWIDVQVTPEAVGPGEMLSMDVAFKGALCDLWGIVTDSIMMAPNPGAEVYPLPVVVIIKEDFSTLTPQQRKDAPVAVVESDRVDIGKVAVNSSEIVTKNVSLTNNGADPLIIRRVYSEDPGVSVSIDKDTLKNKESADISVSFDAAVQPTGIINARFTLITNDPENPTQVIRIVGERF